MTRAIAGALPASPTQAFLALLRTLWREHRCMHLEWTPLDGCPSCGKEP
jgi:hypothetical protein